MCRSDAEIFDQMRDRQLWAYLDEQDSRVREEEEAKEACLNEADVELQHHYDAIAKVVKSLSSRYGFTIEDIMHDMVLPSLEATL